MRRLVCALLLTLPLGPEMGCARATETSTKPPGLTIPNAVTDDPSYAKALNAYAYLTVGDPQRAPLRDLMLTYLVDRSERSAAQGDGEGALVALERAVELFTPAELRAGVSLPRLSEAGLALYERAAREGREFPAAFALAVAEAFGDEATAKKVTAEWEQLVQWLSTGKEFPSRFNQAPAPEIQDVLEQAAASFPSPWLTDELATIYRAQIPILRDVDRSALVETNLHASRADFAGFLLVRAYLRADDLASAKDALVSLGSSEQTKTFREIVLRAAEPSESAQPLNDLIAYIQPEPDSGQNLPPWLITQGWGIVDNLSRRALARDEADPHANLARAQSLRQMGLIDASISYFERALKSKEDLFNAWAALAVMHQMALERDAADAPDFGLERLEKLEAFHRRASELWSDRPIRPDLSDAYVTVANALYDAGHPDRAVPLLRKATALEPRPGALHLLGTIELKVGHLKEARTHYEALAELPFDDQVQRIDWEIRARAQLGEIARRAGDRKASRRELKLALQQLNLVLSLPNLGDEEYSARLVERCRVLFLLGEIDLAMNDFRSSVSATPDSPGVYAEPALLATSLALYPEALEIYRRARSREAIPDSLKLYFSLWLVDLAARQGVAAEPAALEFVRGYNGEPWHNLLAQHALGAATFGDLTANASDAGERAEAFFYEGLRQWRLGARQEAMQLMGKVVDTQMMSFFEYEMAQRYIGTLALP